MVWCPPLLSRQGRMSFRFHKDPLVIEYTPVPVLADYSHSWFAIFSFLFPLTISFLPRSSFSRTLSAFVYMHISLLLLSKKSSVVSFCVLESKASVTWNRLRGGKIRATLRRILAGMPSLLLILAFSGALEMRAIRLDRFGVTTKLSSSRSPQTRSGHLTM